MKRLTIALTFGTVIASFEWQDGSFRIVSVDPVLRESATKWTTVGLDELVRTEDDVEKRFTAASDPAIVERLADYIRRQTGLVVTVE